MNAPKLSQQNVTPKILCILRAVSANIVLFYSALQHLFLFQVFFHVAHFLKIRYHI